MTLTFEPSELKGKASLPCSKSEAHRRLIIGALADTPSVFSGFSESGDVLATLRGLEAMGARFEKQKTALRVLAPCEKGAPVKVDCGESASTLRFLLPLSLFLRGGADFLTHGALADRPLQPYETVLTPLGVHFERSGNRISVRGSLFPGKFNLSGKLSSQFASGLLMTLPFLDGSSVLTVTDPVSEGYLRLTARMLREAGVQFSEEAPFSWKIPGNQRPVSIHTALSPDASAAAVFQCANAIGHQVEMDLPEVPDQPDAALPTLLASDGPFDAAETPDLVPVLSVVLALRPGVHEIIHCERLRLKESDRLAGTVALLNALGGQAETDGSRLIIRGVFRLPGGVEADCLRDHRLVMAAALAATRCRFPVTVTNVEALDKSWPDFLNVYRSLGGRFS